MEIYINSQDGCDWLYVYDNWKEYCGIEDFDETVVITGNRDYQSHINASWYLKAKEMINDLDCYYDYDEWLGIYKKEFTIEQLQKVNELYMKCNYTDTIIVPVCRILYPMEDFTETTIRGYTQGEWQTVIYKGNIDVDMLESVYFGKIAEIYCEDCSTFVTHDELWKWERDGNLEKHIRDEFGINDDEPLDIYEADGYVQSIKWKKVC